MARIAIPATRFSGSLWQLLGLFSLAWGLSACGGTPTPDANSNTSGEATPEASAPAFVLVTRQAPAEATLDPISEQLQGVPIGPTLETSATEDPDRALVFDFIEFSRYGGRLERLDIRLNQDGTFVRNGITGILSPAQVLLIDETLDVLNFFGLQGIYQSLNVDSGNTRYSLRVVRANLDVRMDSEDGYMPNEYISLLALLQAIGQ